MADRVKRQFSKGAIDRAGKLLIPWWLASEDPPPNFTSAYNIIVNWRNSHSMPLLVFRNGLQRRAQRVEADAIIAQRLKRFSSIMNKLSREETMQLSQMQDLGGCRAIVSNVEAVDKLFEMYRGDQPEGKLNCDDYIRHPKPDGYRGIHIVGRYSARAETNKFWNGQRIELQLRSKLQHIFATAVETVTTFTRQPLKFGAGEDDWRRFFALMGSAFAMMEGTPLVSNTPADEKELIRELGELTASLHVRQRLQNWTNAIKELPRQTIYGAKWLLLVLNVPQNTISVKGFSEPRKARQELASIEKSGRSESLDAVLVWVGSISNLKGAYPNYYADTREFLAALDLVLAPKKV